MRQNLYFCCEFFFCHFICVRCILIFYKFTYALSNNSRSFMDTFLEAIRILFSKLYGYFSWSFMDTFLEASWILFSKLHGYFSRSFVDTFLEALWILFSKLCGYFSGSFVDTFLEALWILISKLCGYFSGSFVDTFLEALWILLEQKNSLARYFDQFTGISWQHSGVTYGLNHSWFLLQIKADFCCK